MDDKDFIEIIKFIQGAYSRKLSDDEIKLLRTELKDISIEEFKEDIEFTLMKKVDYFTIQALHKILEEHREIRNWLKGSGLKSLDDLYEN